MKSPFVEAFDCDDTESVCWLPSAHERNSVPCIFLYVAIMSRKCFNDLESFLFRTEIFEIFLSSEMLSN